MTGNEVSKEIIYSETRQTDAPEAEEQEIIERIKKLETERDFMAKNLKRLEEEGLMLKEMFNNTSNELTNMKKPALLVAEVGGIFNDKAIVRFTNGNKFYCYVNKDARKIKIGDTVLVDQKTLNVVDKVEHSQEFEVERFIILEKPKEQWEDIGGLDESIREMKEVIELPIKSPQLFERVGITPPKGVLLYGPPGTGKTLLAKAAANSTNATFIEVVGSELVQKFIGEGAKLVKEIFELARKKAPTIIFIDEIDAIAAVRMEIGTSGEREVNRTFMQLLAELDGFEPLGKVKVIGATNRIDILDKAITRPGRLDRLIEIGLPDAEGRKEIFKIHTGRMRLKNVKVAELVKEMEGTSGAEIRAVCTEAGYFAIRSKREIVTHKDFLLAIEKVRRDETDEAEHVRKFFG